MFKGLRQGRSTLTDKDKESEREREGEKINERKDIRMRKKGNERLQDERSRTTEVKTRQLWFPWRRGNT